MSKITKKQKAAATKEIAARIAQIGVLWLECADIADKNRVSFSYEGPDGYGSGGVYYPPKPADWLECEDYDSDPNEKHPEYEEYHPWSDSGNFSWNDGQGKWVSSSSRC